ncbi:FKBP-type peptidyl-prolyl cis-trans isomerase SlyD [Marinobacterium sp. xm-a-121]|jgi:FKBP-type peptidyl-prolyl cis-trans isomerase SlyD|uniref:FKBP-type peptidyl-prolyl cis-trans isomerase n=1 Tax=unclassified Marinobacterium TaxID=2644139 RepID=UPI00156913AD|nr:MULTISPECIES: peptidylprolyl isomerase [unclassified Marinobacterium]NRP09545.1 FKBP-type peptidyl-prolyl cis-trans isomerase SlyD [Marinobacterium sp. xm-g-48]NRP28462.1 FKBP-type peptidyl-prolyl cis-trans isomerase SlyD [Marinobacterium sp. xm-d-420]NRP37892.1 FKBP-type peptidyl-prolyl cis-trans isomerase SlyD [Marinobacterium sp. xm-a-121]NRP46333.1 FKBP-type peptidyl-prolyl cis-trans isomerase SlyD [Marinobacterium sp. xm-d-543]NRP52689.1 FKBP-type peptidyl-prolyl cis-trans isomerase Sl
MQIADKTVVSIHYTLTNALGETIDSSVGQDPLVYLQGAQNIIPGLENALTGKAVGDALQVTVEPAEGYGEIRDELIQEVDRSAFQGVDDIDVGMQFMAQTPWGEQPVTVVKVEGDQITLDGNHQLAGETLNFDVEVVEVREATAEEVEHGHVHGAGGHHH